MFNQMHVKVTEMIENTYNTNTSPTASDISTTSSNSETQPIKNICSDCGTSKTPLWRSGPDGPKSLCNACGIRSRKRRRAALLGLTNRNEESEMKKSESKNNLSGDFVEKKMWCDGRSQGLMWPKSTAEKKRRVLGEEEQAAILLMAMAYSYVLA